MDRPPLADALIGLGDDHLILGHRLSEWCGHAPMLEEDLSLPNMALDLIGQARALYQHGCALEGDGRTEDDLAYFRTDRQYRNILMVERPNGDFAHTMLRQLYFAAFMVPFWEAASDSTDATVAGVAAKAYKEMRYHVRHAGEWVVRLGDGTQESARRTREAVEALHLYTDEMFQPSSSMATCAEDGLLPDVTALRAPWQATVDEVFRLAQIEAPAVEYPQRGGRDGMHTEALGPLLAEMQSLQRQMPGLAW